jgi:Arc/MetJ-type ribon-helix-helix transcriptional regulator
MKDQRNKVTLKIPRPLYEKITTVIEGSGYNSVTDFVVYVLRDLLASRQHDSGDGHSETEEVKKRLQTLGYLE